MRAALPVANPPRSLGSWIIREMVVAVVLKPDWWKGPWRLRRILSHSVNVERAEVDGIPIFTRQKRRRVASWITPRTILDWSLIVLCR